MDVMAGGETAHENRVGAKFDGPCLPFGATLCTSPLERKSAQESSCSERNCWTASFSAMNNERVVDGQEGAADIEHI